MSFLLVSMNECQIILKHWKKWNKLCMYVCTKSGKKGDKAEMGKL